MTQVIDGVSIEEVSVLQLIYIKETVVGDDVERDYITVERAEGQLPEQQILNRVLRFDVEDYWKYQVEKSVDADDWPVDQAGLEDWLRTLTVRHISGEQPASRIVRWVQEGWEPMRFILEDGQLLSAKEAVVVTEGGPLEAPASPDPDRYRNAILVDPDGRYLRYHSRRGGLEYTQRADEAQRYYPSEAAQIAAKTIFKVVTLPVDNRAYRAMEDKVSEFARQVMKMKVELGNFTSSEAPEVFEIQQALSEAGWAAYELEQKLSSVGQELYSISSVAMFIGIQHDLNKAAEGLDE